ncbi:Metallo-dependent phosphatase-like protein [Entophlyctis helioformis]|nr:Metallo-dependent phosphatase-like protein [Entophlyctis helioformis]
MPTPQKLYFNTNGTFRLVQFTDLHYFNDATTIQGNQRVVRDVLAWESPDMAVFSGDLRMHSLAVQPAVDAAVPYAIILGNHDNEADMELLDIMQMDSQVPLSRTLTGVVSPNGVDYFMPVWRRGSGAAGPLLANGTSGQPTNGTAGAGGDVAADTVGAMLVFLYSGQHECMGVPKWGCVTPDQIAWLKASLGSYMAQISSTPGSPPAATIPISVFLHIPPPEYMDIRNNLAIHGFSNETTACPSVNTGTMDAFELLGVTTVQCGHDHLNDFYASIGSVTYMYGSKTGYGSYGPQPGVPRGARVLELTAANKTFATWIRTEKGDVQAQREARHMPSTQTRCSDSQLKMLVPDAGMLPADLAIVVVGFVAPLMLIGLLAWRLRRRIMPHFKAYSAVASSCPS